MKFLLTGGAGFIGSHTVRRLLTEGHAVVVLDSFNEFYDPQIKRNNIAALQTLAEQSKNGATLQVTEADITDSEAVKKIIQDGHFDTIIHLAARAGVRPSIQKPRLYLETNITGTFNLLEAANDAGCKHFIFASSSSVYGLAETVPFSENMPLPRTLSPYAATKLAGEQLCANFSHLYDMRTVCLRFFTVYGPSQRPDLAIYKFTNMIDQGQPIPKFGDGNTRRDYTYVDDIVDGIIGAISYRDKKFDIFNLGESETTTLNALIEQIEKALGKKALIEQLPEQPGDMPRTCADITKAHHLIGYNPQTKISQGIPKFIEWYRKHKG
ncbi:MAG: SDR family NAD(P)-dependent oxidoreductase [Chthoniobacterales bacterium]